MSDNHSSTSNTLSQKNINPLAKHWDIAAITIFGLCIDTLAVRSIIFLAPFIRSGLNIKESQYAYLSAAITGGTLLAVLPIGHRLDHLETRNVFPLLMIGMGLDFIIFSFQKSLIGLLVTLFILGLIRAGIFPLINRLISRTFSPAYRGVVMGIIYAASPFGGFLGAITLPPLGSYKGWETCYLILGIITLCGGLICRNQIPKDYSKLSSVNNDNSPSYVRSPLFLKIAIVYGFYVLSMSVEVFITLFFVDVVKTTPVTAGFFSGLIQLVGIGGRLFWGFMADQFFSKNRIWLLSIVNWLSVVAYTMLILLNSSSRIWLIALVSIAIGLSIASSWGILSTVIGDIVGSNSIAVATSTVFFITSIADVLGPILFGISLESTQSYQKTIVIFTAITACTALTFTSIAWRDGKNLPQS